MIPQAGRNLDLTGHTLVLPGAGGVAGLGELAVDAVITTFGLSRAAVVQTPFLLPGVTSSAWKLPADQQAAKLELTTAAELYQSDAVPCLSVLQMRSPPVDGRRRALAKELWMWAAKAGVSQIVVVGPVAAYMRLDTDLNSASPIRITSAGLGNADDITSLLTKAGLGQFVLPLAGPAEPEDVESVAREKDLVAVQQMLRGGGVTRPLLSEAVEAASSEQRLPEILALLAFSVPSVDMGTLEQLAKAACALTAARLGVPPPAMQFPPSWALASAAQFAGA